MKSFDEYFAENVRDAFDRYEEPVDAQAFELIRTRLSKGRFWGLRGTLPAYAAAITVLAAAGYLWINHLDTLRNWSGSTDSITSDTSILPKPSEQLTFLSEADQNESGGEKLPAEPSSNTIDNSLPSRNSESEITGAPVQSTGILRLPEPGIASTGMHPKLIEITSDRERIMHTLSQDRRPVAPLVQANMLYSEDTRTITVPHTELSRRNTMELMVGSMVTIANRQLTEGMGFSGGAVHFWKISDRWSVSTGGILAYNQFEYKPSDQTNLMQAMSQPQTFGPFNFEVETRQRVGLLALDIPINARYEFPGLGSGNYSMTVGLSSLLYISQSFMMEGDVYSGEASFNTSTGQTEIAVLSVPFSDREEAAALSRFDAGRLLNLSFGFEPGGKGSPVSVELYLKYPISTLTDQDISMAMSGVTLRYNLGR